MTNPAVFIVTGAVMVFAAVFAIFTASASRPQATQYDRYDREGRSNAASYWSPSPPPSPVRRRERKRRSPERRPSPERHQNSPTEVLVPDNNQQKTCKNCGAALFKKIEPCNYDSLCKGCLMQHLEVNSTHPTCPECSGRIDSFSPPIPPFGRCTACENCTKLFKFRNCGHSLSLCISCFEEQNVNYRDCPECNQKIKGSEPKWDTSGLCSVCHYFTKFAVFQPCDHIGKFCGTDALWYLERNGGKCSECEVVANVA